MALNRLAIVLLFSIPVLPGCMDESLPSVEVTVLDESGTPASGAEVSLHAARTDWAGYEHPIDPQVTGPDGTAVLEAPGGGRYFVNIAAGERNNRFGKKRTEYKLGSGQTVAETFTIRPPTEWERILSGGDHLVWRLAPLMTPQGEPFLDYPVDTDMYIDGRWFDSNGRLGLWWFSPDETKIYYDYATSGAIVESRMIHLDDEQFLAEIDFFGIRMRIEMFPV